MASFLAAEAEYSASLDAAYNASAERSDTEAHIAALRARVDAGRQAIGPCAVYDPSADLALLASLERLLSLCNAAELAAWAKVDTAAAALERAWDDRARAFGEYLGALRWVISIRGASGTAAVACGPRTCMDCHGHFADPGPERDWWGLLSDITSAAYYEDVKWLASSTAQALVLAYTAGLFSAAGSVVGDLPGRDLEYDDKVKEEYFERPLNRDAHHGFPTSFDPEIVDGDPDFIDEDYKEWRRPGAVGRDDGGPPREGRFEVGGTERELPDGRRVLRITHRFFRETKKSGAP